MSRSPCAQCGGSMEGKRPHAQYCSRRCKTRASDDRRLADGRARERDRARYAREAENRRAYARQYLQDNAERMRAVRRKRKGQIRGDLRLVTDKDWRRMVARYRGCCAYCGEKSDTLHRDHVIPLARGGRHSIGNLLPACPRCNYRKRTKLLAEWRLEQRREVIPHLHLSSTGARHRARGVSHRDRMARSAVDPRAHLAAQP